MTLVHHQHKVRPKATKQIKESFNNELKRYWFERKYLNEVKGRSPHAVRYWFLIPNMMNHCPKVQIVSLSDLHAPWPFISL